MLFAKVPTRLTIGAMLFFAVMVNYTMRVNLSVNIVDMVPAVTNNSHANTTLGWSAYERALVLGGYFWGYMGANFIGGNVAERYGATNTILITMFLSALLTFASPTVAKTDYLVMVILRVILGFLGGFTLPAEHVLISHWAVPFEKGMFVSAVISGTIGTVVAWSICGITIDAFGWEWAFHIFGLLALVWCLPWWYFVHDSPVVHPRISAAETQYICEGTTTNFKKFKVIPPYGRILTSVPVWALMILQFGNCWGVYFILNAAPMFITNVLNYNISSTGFLSSLTYLCRSTFAFLFGFLGDFLLNRKLISLKVLRKSFVIFSHVIPGCLLLVLTYAHRPLVAMALMTLSIGLNGAVTTTCAANNLDLAPNFAGTIQGVGISAATLAGILTPLVVAYFTQDDETNFKAWQPVFYTGATFYIATAIIFIMFGSVEVQPFNTIESEVDNNIGNKKEKEIKENDELTCASVDFMVVPAKP